MAFFHTCIKEGRSSNKGELPSKREIMKFLRSHQLQDAYLKLRSKI